MVIFHSCGTVYQRVLLKFPFCGVLSFRPIRWRWTSIIFLGIYLARVERREPSKRLLLCLLAQKLGVPLGCSRNSVEHVSGARYYPFRQLLDCYSAPGPSVAVSGPPKIRMRLGGAEVTRHFQVNGATGRAKSKCTIHQNDCLYLLKLDLPNILICLDCMKPPSLTLCWVQYWHVMHDFQPPGSSVWRR